jgi:hypothetical protein
MVKLLSSQVSSRDSWKKEGKREATDEVKSHGLTLLPFLFFCTSRFQK